VISGAAGEEQAKVEVLSARLFELGEDVEVLLGGVAGSAAENDDDDDGAKVDELL
jgi:hypothetical protein